MEVFDWRSRSAAEVVAASGVRIRWLIGPADGAERFAMRLFELAPKSAIALHQHWYEQEMFFLEGNAVTVDATGVEHPVRPGAVVWVRPNEVHGFRNVGITTVRFLCCVPLEEVAR
jgi:quercetin dioxygenase-like cupin family protein